MNLYLVRHGDALPVGGAVASDAERPLSPQGERDITLVGDVIAGEQPGDVHVFASPLMRARQSAAIIAGKLRGVPVVSASENLAPGFRPTALLNELAHVDPDAIVVVGHQPDLTAFLSYVIADQSYANIAFPPGGTAKISMKSAHNGNDATLQWLLTPELVHRILSTR